MNFSAFCYLTLSAFDRLENEYLTSHVIKKDYILFRGSEFYLEVYFEKYIEVNVNFSFYENGKHANISLKNIMTYLNFAEKELNQVTKNQFSSENSYRIWISEIARICELVVKAILLDSNLLTDCYCWQKEMNDIFLYNVNMDYAKRKLNDFWKSKNYSMYLSYYLNECKDFIEDSSFTIFEKRAKYIQKNQKIRGRYYDFPKS